MGVRRRSGGSCWAALAACAALAGCATRAARELPEGADLGPAPGRLTADVSTPRLGPLAAHRITPGQGLDPTSIAILAVLNNPDLKARRAAAKVPAAQVFAARLLPDPQVTANLDVPFTPGVATAYGVAPSLDLAALITHAAALKAARATATQADLELLWSEWATAQQARQLAVTILADDEKIPVLRTIRDALAERVAVTRSSLERGDMAGPVANVDLAAALDAQASLTGAEHDAAKARGDLNALLGVAPDVALSLAPGTPEGVLDPDAAGRALAALPGRRPDLLALRAGYAAQDANVRKAIIARFPILNLGFNHASDNSSAVSNGVAATFTLPMFNHGRGEIAIQSATRDQLWAEYQARLDQTAADAAAALRERETARARVRALEAAAPALASAAAAADAPYYRRDIDGATYLAAQQASLGRKAALLDQRLALSLADIGLETVLFLTADPPGAKDPPS
jgi:outer membrane protein TolC